MGQNELLLILTSFLTVGLILIAWKLDKARLHSIILIFLILISLGGGKIVEFFGFVTNTGNIFYAGVFLATYFLIERYGKREGIRSIWIGAVGVVAFTLLFEITIALQSAEHTELLSASLSSAFADAPRVAFASLIAYIAAQSLNVFLYNSLKTQFDNSNLRRLWLRVNVSNVFAQLLDSIVFFTIVFWGVVAPGQVWEVLITGFVLKVFFVAVFSPLLYFNRIEEDNHKEYASLTLR